MWDQMKQAKELYKLQKEAEKEEVEVEKGGVTVVVSGKMEVKRVELNADITKEEQEKLLTECFNEAMSKIKMNLAQKMQSLR